MDQALTDFALWCVCILCLACRAAALAIARRIVTARQEGLEPYFIMAKELQPLTSHVDRPMRRLAEFVLYLAGKHS